MSERPNSELLTGLYKRESQYGEYYEVTLSAQKAETIAAQLRDFTASATADQTVKIRVSASNPEKKASSETYPDIFLRLVLGKRGERPRDNGQSL